MRDEKSRQGVDFVWGTKTDAATLARSQVDSIATNVEGTSSVTDPTATVESNITSVSEGIKDSKSYSFFDDAEDTELYIGYFTFGLNIIFLLLLIAWITNKCCCANRNKPIMDYLSFLKR